MSRKNIFNVLYFLVIFLWIIPSAYFYDVDRGIVLFYFAFHIIISLLYTIQFIKICKDKRNLQFESILIYLSIIGSMMIHVMTYICLLALGKESNIKIISLILIIRAMAIIPIVISRYPNTDFKLKDKINSKEDKLKFDIEENKRDKKENTSNKMIFEILIKIFKAHYKNYIVFLVSSILTVTYVHGFLGNLIIIHKIQQTNISYIVEGITSIVLNAFIVITIITILIQYFSLKNYIQNRMHDFKTLALLGMENKDISKCMRLLLIITLCIAYFIGVIFGNSLIFIFKQIYSFYFKNITIPNPNTMFLIISSLIICIIIIGFTMGIIQYMVIESSMLKISESSTEEKMPIKGKKIFILPILLIALIVLYSNPHLAESRYIIYLWFIIFVIFLYYSVGYILKKLKQKKEFYFNNILSFNLMYYNSKSYLRNSLLLYSLLFIMFFTYIFQIATLIPLESKELYPYNYVCLGYSEDKVELQNISKKFNVESELYPVVRVTVPGGEDGGYGDLFKTLPIGHHLGISESTYKNLSGKDLDLKEKQIFVLYQEDKSNIAHPLDFYVIRSKPLIRLGEPELYAFENRKFFFSTDYSLAGEKREILFGKLSNIMYENIVVFSDQHFNSQYKQVNGIKWLLTINNSSKDDKALENYLDGYENTHNGEKIVDSHIQSVYKASDLYKAFQGEKIFKLLIYASILSTFVIASIIIIFVYVFGNISYYKNRQDILNFLGEKEENYNSIIKKEVKLFARVPFILAILTSLVFITITIKMRGFNYLEIVMGMKVYFSVILAFLIIYEVATFIISKLLIKEIGGK